jgi:hypothetical protein
MGTLPAGISNPGIPQGGFLQPGSNATTGLAQRGQANPVSALMGLLGQLQTAGQPFTQGGLGGPAFNNPFQQNTNNPFLTGEFAPTSFDPFTGGGISTGNNPAIRTDRENNLQSRPTQPGFTSPFRRGVGTRGLLGGGRVGGRRGLFQVR